MRLRLYILRVCRTTDSIRRRCISHHDAPMGRFFQARLLDNQVSANTIPNDTYVFGKLSARWFQPPSSLAPTPFQLWRYRPWTIGPAGGWWCTPSCAVLSYAGIHAGSSLLLLSWSYFFFCEFALTLLTVGGKEILRSINKNLKRNQWRTVEYVARSCWRMIQKFIVLGVTSRTLGGGRLVCVVPSDISGVFRNLRFVSLCLCNLITALKSIQRPRH